MTHVFNIKRFGLLLKMELCNSRRGILMTLIITLGFLFFVGLLLNPVFDPNLAVIEHYSGYHFTLFLCGFIFSSLAFRETCDSLHCYRYLTLPVSSFERFFSMWLLTAIGWLVCYTLIFWLYTLFANSAGRLVYPHLRFEAFHPFSASTLLGMRLYLVLQSIFLAGAAHFRKYAFPKTLLTLVLFAAVCGLIAYFFMRNQFNVQCEPNMEHFRTMSAYPLCLVLREAFWWLLAPLCWAIAYFGLKEQEV